MIIPDVNVLVHAHNTGVPEYPLARTWWEQAVNESQPPIGLAWVSILGFMRLCTGHIVLDKPMSVSEASGIVRSWLAQPTIRIIVPGERHVDVLLGLLDQVGVAGNLTTDAHLAALAIEYRADIATTDGDFHRFRGVRWFNPLKPGKRR